MLWLGTDIPSQLRQDAASPLPPALREAMTNDLAETTFGLVRGHLVWVSPTGFEPALPP
jgi:hypothetical protein